MQRSVVILALLISSFVTSPGHQAHAEDCADVLFIGLRGSGEKHEGNGGMGRVVADAFRRYSSSLHEVTVQGHGLHYPAVHFAKFKDLRPEYFKSVSDGVVDLRSFIDGEVQRCQHDPQRVILAGYSQGAHVVGDFLESVPTPQQGRIIGAVLFGDPRFNPHSSAAKGNYSHARDGLLSTRRPFDPWLEGRVASYCRRFDPVCQGLSNRWAEIAIGIGAHFRYTDWETADAATMLAALTPPPDTPPPPPPPPPDEVRIVDDPSIWGPAGPARRTDVGWDGDVWSTGAEGSGHAAVNGAEWITDIDGGTYSVEAFVPKNWATATPNYYIRNNCGESVVRVDQSVWHDQWVPLGTFAINGPRASVGSNDIADPRGSIVGWDAIRWTKVDRAADPCQQQPPPPPPQNEVRVVDDPSIWGPAGPARRTDVGWDGDVWSTGAEGSGHAAVNGAEWITDINGGTYSVEAFVPKNWATATVNYYIRHNGGQSVVRVDQSVWHDEWVPLGTFAINGPRASVGSNDIADPRGSIVGWDAVRWTRVGP